MECETAHPRNACLLTRPAMLQPSHPPDKRRKHSLLLLLKKAGAFSAARACGGKAIRILCYHGVWRGNDAFAGDSMFISQTTFERRIALVRRLGFHVIPLELAVLGLQRRAEIPRDSVVITIDDGWYSSFACMLQTLRRESMPATIYCDTRNLISGLPVPHVMAHYLRDIFWPTAELPAGSQAAFARATDLTLDQKARFEAVLEFAERSGIDISPYLERRAFGYMTEEEIATAAAQGFAIELHTHTHSLGNFTFSEVAREITLNREILARILDRPPDRFRHFCYPSGKVRPGVQDALSRLGIASATTLDSGIAYPGADPLMLPRIVDGDHLSDLEFEAELCGVGTFVRRTRAAGKRLMSRSTDSAPADSTANA